MTTVNATETTKSNRPTHDIFTVEEKDGETVWTKVGVVFATKSGNSHRVLIGEREDPKRRVYLVCPNSSQDDSDDRRADEEKKRRPYATIYDTTAGGDIDFKKGDGVAFLNRDNSLTLLIGEKGDPMQQRFQMRLVRPKPTPPKKAA
jgi:hypothetical protein